MVVSDVIESIDYISMRTDVTHSIALFDDLTLSSDCFLRLFSETSCIDSHGHVGYGTHPHANVFIPTCSCTYVRSCAFLIVLDKAPKGQAGFRLWA